MRGSSDIMAAGSGAFAINPLRRAINLLPPDSGADRARLCARHRVPTETRLKRKPMGSDVPQIDSAGGM